MYSQSFEDIEYRNMDRRFNFEKEKEISDEMLSTLKNSKTILFLKFTKKDTAWSNSFINTIKKTWTLTEVIVEDIKRIEEYKNNPNYSLLLIEGSYILKSNATGNGSSFSDFRQPNSYNLVLIVNVPNKKGTKVISEVIGSFEFACSNKFSESRRIGPDMFEKSSVFNESVNFDVYSNLKKGGLVNFIPTYIAAHLKVISVNLTTKKIRPERTVDYKSEDLKVRLAKDTLYILKSLFQLQDKVGRSEVNKNNEKIFLANYKYPYRVCTEEELYKIFFIENRGRLLFDYGYSSYHKYIKIIDFKEGIYVYKFFGSKLKSPLLNENDFEKISEIK
jgi:hypothetical protein